MDEPLSSTWSSMWDRTRQLPPRLRPLVLTIGIALIAFVVIVLPIIILQMFGRLVGEMIGG